MRYSSHRPVHRSAVRRGAMVARGTPGRTPVDPEDPPDLPPPVDPEDPPPDPGEFVLRVTKPIAANTGYTSPPPGDTGGGIWYIDTPNTDITGLTIERQIVVRAPGVHIYDNDIIGPNSAPPGAGPYVLVDCRHSAAVGTVVEYNRVCPQFPSPLWHALIDGHDFVAQYNDLSGAIDCFAVRFGDNATYANVQILGNYGHDLRYWCPYPSQPDNYSHNDIIQMFYSSGHRYVQVVGNNFQAFIDTDSDDYHSPTWQGTPFASKLLSGHPHAPGASQAELGYSTSCVMMSPKGTGTSITEVYLEDNWANGGRNGAFVIGSQWAGTSGHSLKVRYQKWGRDFYNGDHFTMTKPSTFHFTGASEIAGNYYEDDETPYNQGGCCGTWP